ncbi:MAG: polysaccharide biosynthesis C-terminal domain-containing protein [Ignavibacteriota bacterium]
MRKSETTEPAPPKANTRIVAKNAAWMSVDAVFSLVLTTAISVAVAQVIGPARLGSYSYVVLLTTITLTMGSFGLPATARKYIAEYLNNGNPGVARATYLSTLKLQCFISVLAGAIGYVAVDLLADRNYRTAGLLLVIAIVPRLIATIPSQANNASEVYRRNTIPSVFGVALTSAITAVSLILGWDLVGLSAATLAGSTLECAMKLYMVEQWMGGIPRGAVAPELRRRMVTFSGQEMALLLLNLLVWDRSDFVVLKAMNPDTRQIAFFSLPFSLAERALMLPSLFAGALGFTMMAQHGRGESRVKEMTVEGGRYALLLALPLLVGMACVSRPLVLLIYTQKYAPMIPTLAIIALLAVPKALITAPTYLLQTMERQGFLVIWGMLCGAVDIGLDVLLVGRYGANGAAIANGSAQAMAALGIWIYVWKIAKLDLPLLDCARIVASAAIMAAGVLAILHVLTGVVGLVVAVIAGAALWFAGLRITGALKAQDVSRFRSVGKQLPGSMQKWWERLIVWLAPSVELG